MSNTCGAPSCAFHAVIADDSAAPDLAAADLLAQAEHDVLATPVLVTTSRAQAEAIAAQVEAQLETLERHVIARAAIERGGAIVARRPEKGDDWRATLRSPRWNAAPLKNPEMNPTSRPLSALFWIVLAALTFGILVIGYSVGFWR